MNRLQGVTVGEKKKKRTGRVVAIVIACILALLSGFYFYVSDYYHASDAAVAAITSPAEGIEVEEYKDKMIVFRPEKPVAGLIFYPGGKVDYKAYAPLMQKFADNGVLCVLVHMPFNLAVFGSNAADGIPEQFPEIEDWYMAGHSLGGAFASKYTKSHAQAFRGLILLGAYSCYDLTDTDLKVACIYGSQDGVMNFDKYEKNRKNLPDNHIENVIDGGCHAYFGDYGEQKGDGVASISVEEQMETTVDLSMQIIKDNNEQ